MTAALRAVIFDLWGTLVPFDSVHWQRKYAEMAGVLGVPRERFEQAATTS